MVTKECWDIKECTTALVFSKLYYCSNVWENTTEKNILKLQAVQNFACRIVSGARKYDHVTPYLKSLSWLPVKDQLYYRQAIMPQQPQDKEDFITELLDFGTI